MKYNSHCFPYNSSDSTSTLTNKELIDYITYELIASIFYQCDSNKSFRIDTFSANSTTFRQHKCDRDNRNLQQIAEIKKGSRCKN